MHKHKCANQSCGVIWEHSYDDEQRTHICPVCGLATFTIYDGPDAATTPDEIRLGQSLRGALAS